LTYQNPYFEGPSATSADELIKIDFVPLPGIQSPSNVESPWLGDHLTNNSLSHRGRYNPDWTLRFAATAPSTEPFVLDSRAYRLETYKTVNEPFIPKDVYLDVNESWKKNEFETAFQEATRTSHSRVWVFDDGMKQLTTANLDETYDRLSRQRFSLFPVYRITDPATALLITKGTPASPTLSDLTNSQFADRMQKTATQRGSIRTFCYSNDLSPYLKTLSELRVLTVMHGTTANLTNRVLTVGQFPRQPDEKGLVLLPEAGVAIRETTVQSADNHPDERATGTTQGLENASTAPDHLARLFTYNHLLQQIGRQYFAKNYQTDTLIQEAQRAHVVSPLSSLVVLETAWDYERFGIKKDQSGLDNATLKEEGAVPEPYEWALLTMVAVLIGWMLWKKRYAVA
jgi:XrtN system VIT domain protein